MPISVIVNGAYGKMGSLACETLKKDPNFKLAATLGRDDDLYEAIHQHEAKVVVDLTRADSVFENSLKIIKAGACPVIGTSGLLEEQIQVLKEQCELKKLGGIIVPNFSIGAILMMRFAKIAAAFLPEVEIIEYHHQQKLDAPSGTAMKTADMIAKSRAEGRNELALKEVIPGARGGVEQDIHIHAVRLPGFIARQDIIFGALGETLTLSHNSIDRISFMPGLVLACNKVTKLDSLYYGLESLLEEYYPAG